jgi:hypothetical protein
MTKLQEINKSGLNKRQKDTLKRHMKLHTLRHMKFMIVEMKKGRTFADGHKKAMKMVGR